MLKDRTIAAIATSTGIGGIGIVRLSGRESLAIAQKMTRLTEFTPRMAQFSPFLDESGT
ncbi:MAG: tRNA uridine-5-carboxymethylaminomethyl(34) synthesis GTPase MnmE, partial [Xanthomonadaceae bacterium]|nr:tRNA uridine-5-carboxymethylaminomethyl(34) synthesis GTPase MnmE [Xanthomonadaceae bacterium]